MSLSYRVYWIDDDTDFPASVLENLKIEFTDDELEFDISVELNGRNLEAVSRSEHLDFVILDYNLDGKNGDVLLRDLRASGELTEVVFYSQDPDVHAKCEDLEGVHVCERNEAEDRISEVIRGFLARCKNVAVMRGMIISEAIDVENRLTELILDMFGDKAELFQTRILNKPFMDFGKKIFFVNGEVSDLISKENLKIRPDTQWINRLTVCKEVLKGLDKEIMQPRNILAHSKKSFEDGVITLAPLTKSDPIKFDDEWKNNIRKNVKTHLENLASLREILKEKAG